MKRYFLCFLSFLFIVSLFCGCGNVVYTAIPELKISWEMSPEELKKAAPAALHRNESENGTMMQSMPDAKLPDICGLPLEGYACYYSADGRMVNILLRFGVYDKDLGMINYKTVVDAYTECYGSPDISVRGSINLMTGVFQNACSVWNLDFSTIEVVGDYNGMMLTYVLYHEPSSFEEQTPEQNEASAEDAAPSPAVEEAPHDISSDMYAPYNIWRGDLTQRQVIEIIQGDWISDDVPDLILTVKADGTFFWNGEACTIESFNSYEDNYFMIIVSCEETMGSLNFFMNDGYLQVYDLQGVPENETVLFIHNDN